jgi:two-component system cell cycle sensor histidine kinase/response regulator CckA
MSEPTRILIVEDLATDAELAEREINKALNSCVFQRVEMREDYLAALATFQPDLIVSDYQMPRFDGLTALKLALEREPYTPLIILTGAMNEDTAVECMKAGATDYVIKEHIKRLGSAVIHALEEKQIRRERRQAEEALRESEERYRTLAEAANDAIFIVDADGTYQYINRFGAQLLGLQPQDMIGREHSSFFPPAIADRHKLSLQGVLESGKLVHEEEGPIPTPDGDKWLSTSLVPLGEKPGGVGAVLGIARDFTEHKRAEEERERLLAQIQEQAQRVQQIMDTVPEGVLLLDAGAVAGWRVALANPVAEEALAVLAGDAQETLTHMGDRSLAELLASPSHGAWHEVRVSGPPSQTFEVIARPIEAGPAAGSWTLVVREVTQERENQRRVQQQERLAAIGQLTAGIAHDFNNLLTAINGFADLGRMQFPQDAPVQELLGKILHSGRRAADLIRQLLIFSRKQTIEPIVLNLNEVVASMDKMLRRVIGEDVDLAVALTPDLWPVKVDPTQIEVVILNLAVNARDAMPRGGRLTIEASNLVLGEDYVAGHTETQPGQYVLLAVSDTGVGMSDEVKAHVFEPFFTTKEPGKGTGLGLSTVFGIVKQSGGNIWVYSEEGQGTTFKIYLPRVMESAQSASHLESGQAMPSGSETILLVEDADSVRELVRRTLQNQDYTVLEARGGQEALQIADLHTGPIHLLLTDVIMPGISSKTLIEQVTQTYPDIKILLISGYTDNAIMQYGVLKPGVAFLQKPFSPLDLARKVRRVLDETR